MSEAEGARDLWLVLPIAIGSTSHVHLIIGSKQNLLENIVRDMKKHTSPELKVAIKSNSAESRKEWMNWMFERAGKKNGNNANWQFWQYESGGVWFC